MSSGAMATKVHSKSYLPGYSLMRDLNDDPNNMCSRYYLDKKVNENLYVNHQQKPVNEYLAYEKEMLKQTMLEHEAIFRKQVYELHRLYRVQKDMMDELQTRELHKSSVPEETYQSNSLSSLMQSENSQMIWPFRMVKNCHEHSPIGSSHEMKAPSTFTIEGSIQSGIFSSKNSSSLKEIVSADHKFQKQCRRMLDLHLPADAYIDLEDDDQCKKKGMLESSAFGAEIPLFSSSSDGIVNLTLGNEKSNGSRETDCLLGLKTSNVIPAEHSGALNNYATKTFAGHQEKSTSNEFLVARTRTERNLEHHMVVKSNRNHDDGFSSKNSVAVFGDLSGETAGRNGKDLELSSQSLYNGRFSLQSGPLQSHSDKIHESHSTVSNKLDTLFTNKPVNGSETSPRNSYVKISNNSSSMFPSLPAFLVAPHNNFISPSSLASLGTKPLNGMKYLPTSIKELPCFNALSNIMTKSVSAITATQNAAATWETRPNDDNLVSGLRANGDDPYYAVGSYHRHLKASCAQQSPFLPDKLKHLGNTNNSVNGNVGHQSNSSKDLRGGSLVPMKKINVNQALPRQTDASLVNQVDLVAHSMERRNKDLPGVPSWLRKKVECSKQPVDLNSLASDVELAFSDDHCKLPNTKFFAADIETKEENKTKISGCDFSSTLQLKDEKVQTNKAYDHTNKRFNCFQVPKLPEKVNLFFHSVPQVGPHLHENQKRKGEDELLLDVFSFNQKKSRLNNLADNKEPSAERCVDGKNTINLNVELPCFDEELLPNIEAEKLTYSSQSNCAKTSCKIDLEMSICRDEGTKHESIKLVERAIARESEQFPDTLARLAAENIVTISMHQSSHQVEFTCHRVSPPCDLLHWFAEVALSKTEATNMPSKGEDVRQSLDDNVLDVFEAMTLDLEEVKVHYPSYTVNKLAKKEDTDVEDLGVASQLLTRRRRGQSRRCRQRKDFQKDVLPGLASLSRHEVTEDLQLIEGLLRASGQSWQLGVSRRNSGRKRSNSRAKGRRRLTNYDATSTEIHASSPSPAFAPQPALHNGDEPVVVGSSIVGWGRTTRRCRRQKSQLGNIGSSVE